MKRSRNLSKKIGRLLVRKKLTLAVAESCTGGFLSSVITDVPGSSRYFLLGVVAYSAKQKEKLLKIPKSILKKYSAISPQVTKLMAKNVKKISGADIGMAITGYAGPAGGTKNKPKGTAYISLDSKDKSLVKRFRYRGSRIFIKQKSVRQALFLLSKIL